MNLTEKKIKNQNNKMENLKLENGKLILVANNDLKNVHLEELLEYCSDLNGWRLPNIDELEQIYNNMHIIGKGKFDESFYWSSNAVEKINGLDQGLGFGFSGGVRMNNSIFFKGKARLVKDIDAFSQPTGKINWKGVRKTNSGDVWEIFPLEYSSGNLYCRADDEHGEFEVYGSIDKLKVSMVKKYVSGKVIKFEATSTDDGSFFEGQWTSNEGSGKFDMFKPLAVELD